MKNILESFAIMLVGLFSLLIVFLIVQYNMIEEEGVEEIVFATPATTKESKKAKTSNYLDSLEGYGGDVDVKVDARKESTANTVAVASELASDELGSAVADKSKSSYMENLANYEVVAENDAQEETIKKAMEGTKHAVVVDPSDPEKLEHDEITDEVGMALDSLLDDL
jgi:hypothetical protein